MSRVWQFLMIGGLAGCGLTEERFAQESCVLHNACLDDAGNGAFVADCTVAEDVIGTECTYDVASAQACLDELAVADCSDGSASPVPSCALVFACPLGD